MGAMDAGAAGTVITLQDQRQAADVRTLMRKAGVVPLTAAALKVLELTRERHGSNGLIFPGMRRGRPVSDVSLAKAIARHTDVKATTHGLTTDGLIALADVDLLVELREWIGRVDGPPHDGRPVLPVR